MSIKIVETEEEKKAAFNIRQIVFVYEQQVPIELEIDSYEDEAIHFICYDGDTAIGASRLRFVDDHGKLERICILKPYRGKSYGKHLINKMEVEIVKNGYTKAKLHAQTHAKDFYHFLGYEVISDEFMDAGDRKSVV